MVFHARTGEKVREWKLAAAKLASSFAFTCDGRYLATGLSDGSILVYRLEFRDLNP